MYELSYYNCGKTLFFIVYFLIALVQHASSQSLSTKTGTHHPPVSIPGTEMRTLHSTILNQEMVLYIKLPNNYDIDTHNIYPCWYFTDGNRSFPMIANFENIFEVPGPTNPEIVIVSIGYKIRDMADWAAWRTRDLTTANNSRLDANLNQTLSKLTGRQFNVKSGGSETFLQFIIEEVLPFIESNYRVSSTGRGIGGYSYGGLFSLYVLFKQPELFSIYYAGSPSIGYHQGVVFTFEEAYASAHINLNATLFMTAGGDEDSLMIANVKKMATILDARNYPGLSVETHIFPNETHQSCYPASIMRAFRVLYKR